MAQAGLQRLADRIAILPERVDERLVDDHDRTRRRIARLERAALDDRNAHRLEVVGHHALVVVDVFERALRRRGVVADVGVVGVERPVRRQPRHGAGALDAGDTAQFFEQALIELRARRGLRIVDVRQRHLERDQARSIEARIDDREVVDGADQQARADHEHHRERDFGHHEAAADVMTRRAGRAPGAAFLQRERQSLDARVHQRREAEHQAGGDRHAEREDQHDRIDGDFGGARQARRDTGESAPARRRAPAPGRARRR